MLKPNELFWVPLTDTTKIPTRREEDGGYDIYANFVEDYVIIESLESLPIPTGLASVFHHSKRISFQERGSTGIKNIAYGAGLIDSGFRGEWKVIIRNLNNQPLVISKLSEEKTLERIKEEFNLTILNPNEIVFHSYQKGIVQAKVEDVPKMIEKVISMSEMSEYDSERGEGKYGSSGK